MAGLALAAAAASQLNSELQTDNSSPMDLSSGGGGGGCSLAGLAGVTQLLSRSIYGGLPFSDHPLVNASRLAELVRQQHRESEERERSNPEVKRSWDLSHLQPTHQDPSKPALDPSPATKATNDQSQSLDAEPAAQPDDHQSKPLDLIKSRVAEKSPISGIEEHPAAPRILESPLLRRKSLSPGLSGSPGSPAGSTGSTESGREVKRRRLDELLNKKFEKVGGSGQAEPGTLKPGSPTMESISADPLTNSQMERRDSQDTSPRVNRRKQKRPSNPNTPPKSPSPAAAASPPSLSLRPFADLFPPMMATSSPNKVPRMSSPVSRDPRTISPTPRDLTPPPSSPFPRPTSPIVAATKLDENDNKEMLKNQILQMQLSNALNNPEALKNLQYNPILYYTYYAQMLSNLQAQQKLLSMSSPPSPNNNSDLFSPINLNNKYKESRGSYSPGGGLERSPALSPLGFRDLDEPRKRAPRALTGRYVRTGTAASPRVLQVLRKKIEERLRLKEILADNKHYFTQSSPFKL